MKVYVESVGHHYLMYRVRNSLYILPFEGS